MSSTANPTRQKATEHKDPLVAAAQQKVNEAKQKLEELQAATKAAQKRTEQNEAELDLLRQAAALQEAEVSQRNEELATERNAAQQKIDRINAALNGVTDEPEPATPDESIEAPQAVPSAEGEPEPAPADPEEPPTEDVEHTIGRLLPETSQPEAEEDEAVQDRRWAAATNQPYQKPSLKERWDNFRSRLA